MPSSAPTTQDFDLWRARYAVMTDNERRTWDARCFEHWPEQAHGQLDWIRFSVDVVKPRTVIEVGGWRGDHAAAILGLYPSVERWVNIEFCAEAAAAPKTKDPRYEVRVPGEFRWWREDPLPKGDLLVLSHVIEHLSPRDAEDLLDTATGTPAIYCETPLPTPASDWKGYLGTHILPWTWLDLEKAFHDRGYFCHAYFAEARLFLWGPA